MKTFEPASDAELLEAIKVLGVPKGTKGNTHPAVRFCRKYSPYMPEQECYEAYETYRSYRDEGQSDIVSRQYAGLL